LTVSDLIAKHEGTRLFPYTDTVGKLTIGVGRNLTDVGISQDEADTLLTNDLDRARTGIAEAWPPFVQLDEVRQAVIEDMAFNMGVERLLGFHGTLAAIASGNWQAAHDGMLASKWAGQVGARAIEDATMMLTGQWPA
jgi:lysozyme